MAIVDDDGVAAEDGVHLAHDGGAAGLDAVVRQHGGDVVCEQPVGVQVVLVLVHGGEVDALGQHDARAGLGVGKRVVRLLGCKGAALDARDGVNGSRAAEGLDQGED